MSNELTVINDAAPIKTESVIVLKQLPIIEEHLNSLGAEIDKTVADAKALVCTEANLQSIKNTRSNLNKQFEELEAIRIKIKKEVMKPYEEFLETYNKIVTVKMQGAKVSLTKKIDDVETEQKAKKEEKVKVYFTEYASTLMLDWVDFSKANLNIIKSVADKKLKEQAKAFLDGIKSDVTAIEAMEHSDEIMLDYKTSLDFAKSTSTVLNRHRALEKERERKAQLEQRKEAEEATVANVIEATGRQTFEQAVEARSVPEAFSAPKVISSPVVEQATEAKKHTLKFSAHGTIEQLKELKAFALKIGIELEDLK